jgi:DNA-binding XRE family transcriptional regulator
LIGGGALSSKNGAHTPESKIGPGSVRLLLAAVRKALRTVNKDPYSNPLAFFAAEMARMRTKAGMTQEELAEAAGFAPSTIAAVETCRLLPSEELAQHIDTSLQGDGHFVRLQELVERTSVLPWFRDLVKTEQEAASIQTYESYVVPGLLQTEDYARNAVSATRPRLPDDDIQRAVTLRMTRRGLLDQDDPPRLWAIIDESVLRREAGGKKVMKAQCDHLLKMGQRPHIAIQVFPNSKGPACAYGNNFVILNFNSTSKRRRAPMAYLEDLRTARYIREQDEVSVYATVFDYLRSSALDDLQSADLIRGYRDERYV